MLGLNESQDAALAFLALNRDEDGVSTEDEILVRGILGLRDAGMAKAQTDWGRQAIFIASLTPAGYEKYEKCQRARRGFSPLSESANELLLWTYALYSMRKRAGGKVSIDIQRGREEDYRELARAGLLSITWADDAPYHVNAITQNGILYASGDFCGGGEPMNIINFNPTNNFSPTNTVNVSGGNSTSSADASSSASASSMVTLDYVIDALRSSGLSQEDLVTAESAVRAMNEAAESKDENGFLDALEKVASATKNVAAITGTVIPFIGSLAQTFLH